MVDSMDNPVAPYKPNALVDFLARALVWMGWVSEKKYQDKGWNSYAENLQFKAFKLRFLFSSSKHMDQLRQKMDEVRTVRLFHENYKKLQMRGHLSGVEVTFKHSGNAGDIVYALPTISALCGDRPAKLYLNLDAPINGWTKQQHPSGPSGLTAGMADFLRPMLEHQSGIVSAPNYNNEPVDYDLDIFRQIHSVREGRGHNAHWY